MRSITTLRAAYGMFFLFWSDQVIHTVSGEPAGQAVSIARVLGAHHLLQALIVDRTSSHSWLPAGAALDIVHALSMVAEP